MDRKAAERLARADVKGDVGSFEQRRCLATGSRAAVHRFLANRAPEISITRSSGCSDVNPAIVETPSHDQLVNALDVTLCKHVGLTRAAEAAGVQDHDVIATRRPDGRFDIRQRICGVEHFLEGPLDQADAERRARELAVEEQGDAWILEGVALRLLTG